MKQFRNITYGVNILLTAMVAGLMFFYTFCYGRLFDFLLDNNLTDGLSIYHAQFVEKEKSEVVTCLLIFQLALALITLILNFKKKLLPGLILAFIAPVVLLILNYGTGFSYTEGTIMSGTDLSPENVEFFLKVNIPYHIVYTLCYGIAALWLIFQRKNLES